MSIDWGRGTVNVAENGFRFGIIPHHAVGASWYEESQGVYPQGCPKCGSADFEENEDGELCCQDCEYTGEADEFWAEEARSFNYSDQEYLITQDAESPDIWVMKSPYYTVTEFCSPCAPGAGYLMDSHDEGPCEALCLGHEWFEEGQAPYRVFSVETREEVFPELAEAA